MVKQMEQRMLAKALYDNVAESPDEIAFRRGDVLTILECDTGGLDGWWLCSLRGKQGIAPGNRLKLMSGMVANHVRSHTADYNTSDSPAQGNPDWRRSWDGTTTKVVTPQRQGDMYLYDQPRGSQPDYDVPQHNPRPVHGGLYTTPGSGKSSREDLDNTSGFDQSLYSTPPQSRSVLSPDTSMYDTPPSHIHLDPYDIPSGSVRTSLASKFSDESLMSFSSGLSKSNPASMCDSARSSMDISPMDMYDVPPTQLERELRSGFAVQSSKDSGLDMYDSPPKLKSPPSPNEDYDVPKLSSIDCKKARHIDSLSKTHSEPSSPGPFFEDYDIPKSAIPVDQNERLHTPQSKSQPVSPGFEEYDVPKNNSPSVPSDKLSVCNSACSPKRLKSNSLGSLLEDVPRSEFSNKLYKDSACTNRSLDNLLAQKSTVLQNRSLECLAPSISDDENSYDETDAVVTKQPVIDVKPPLMKQEHAVDDIYDVPKNNAPVKNMTKEFSELSVKQHESRGVYDIPPQVTRDSVISLLSDSSDGSDQRMSSCSFDSGNTDFLIYDELPLELDAANDLVIKLHQDVQKSINRFSGFVHTSWRKKDNIELRLYDIKQSCVGMQSALTEFVEFGQGTLANSAKLSDRKLINKLSKYLIPLQQSLQQINVNIKHLDDADWKITKLINQDSPKRDDLGQITSISKDLLSSVKKLSSFIQGNSSLLFKRAKDFNNRGSRNSGSLSVSLDSGKPPISRKPALPSKLQIQPSVQTRPLPAPPPTERPLPPTPTDKKPDTKRFSGEIKRHSGDYKHWSGEFQVRRLSTGSRGTPEREGRQNGMYSAEDLRQEYDYVQLEGEDGEPEDKHKLNSMENNKTELVSDGKEKSVSRENILETVDECVKENIENDRTTYKGSCEAVDKLEGETRESDSCERTVSMEDDAEKTPVNKEAESELPERDMTPHREVLDPSDRQVLTFYSGQLETHCTLLRNSIDAFFSCIENNQAPKVFISHSKFVVVSAHKLVYIGDTLHHSVKHREVRSKIMESANSLCDCLKQTVMATKTAALQYPSVPAVQEMVDRIVDVSHTTQQLKQLVAQALEL